MNRKAVSGITSSVVALALMTPLAFGSNPLPDSARKELKQKLIASQINLTDTWRLGKAQELGTILVLLQDQVPAREFHTLAQQKPYPRVWHLDDYARVEIVQGQTSTARERGTLSLQRGELLLVVDHKFKDNTIELWTHSLNPVSFEDDPKRAPKHASTKFVFHFPPEVLQSGNIGPIEADISRWFKTFESEWDAREFARTLVK